MGWKRFTFTFSSLVLLALSATKVVSASVSVSILAFPDQIKIDEPFSLTASVSGLPAGQEFKYKVGVATTSTYYGYGQVKKDDIFIGYNDAGSCDSAPTQNVDDSGFWKGEVTANVNRNAKVGEGKLRFKICEPDKTSTSYAVTLTEPDPLPVAEEKTETTSSEESSEESEVSTPTPPIDPTPPTTPSIPTSPTKPSPPLNRLPATLSAIPVSRILGSASAKEASLEGNEATASQKNYLTTYFGRQGLFFAIIAVMGFAIGFVLFSKFIKK